MAAKIVEKKSTIVPDQVHEPRPSSKVFKGADIIVMTYDSEHHRIAIAQVPPIFKRKAELQTGLMHFAFAHNTFEDLADAYEARRAKGIKPFCQVGPNFSQNPIGVDYDPEVFVRRVRAKLPPTELAPRRPMKRSIDDLPSHRGPPVAYRQDVVQFAL
ncbi:hypothetical protein M427DRAFT_39477 [Gonapodya prolifera JEL478]|uniref:Uncharacterized protein n=1 Tax=Gonapodya prolifera (strain JEL478) TaxID=1344416 RepID=A0A138ZXE9_GONPJ|nr:hypothetical protein M427DRAFT_39477 [Gonapodya prolifera JEL478]|eukprot:KXS09159.1 hypothetical protein M427DRAFT_39477 [Gonapodya prolifera JEL478]